MLSNVFHNLIADLVIYQTARTYIVPAAFRTLTSPKAPDAIVIESMFLL